MMTFNTGRAAVYWSWYCSPRRAGGRSYGRKVIGMRGYAEETHDFGNYPGWKVMVSNPHQRYGMAGGNRGARRKVHIVRDQIIAKHTLLPEERMTRWMCNAYTFAAVLQPEATEVCSACLLVAQHRSVEPLPKGMR
jgi:hypothetical protein